MGNRMSLEGRDGYPTHLDYGKPDDTIKAQLRGGGAAQASNGKPNHAARRRAQRTAIHEDDDELCEISKHAFHNGNSNDRSQAYHTPVIRSASGMSSRTTFDFNDDAAPNPWLKDQGVRPNYAEQEPAKAEAHQVYGRNSEPVLKVRRFADCHDRELLAYLDLRGIARGFLTEIDQFLRGHPEIALVPEGRIALRDYYTLPPLEAYKHFLRGWTKPARYVDGVIETERFALPPGVIYQPLRTRHDPELADFFDGFDFRHDIIDRIDVAVIAGMREWLVHRKISRHLRKLICYALWGQPVDAYKFFEYCYQDSYMPHRYLPDHVILGHVPKPVSATKLPPSKMDYTYRRHNDVRQRMLKAEEQGVDILQVLISEYRHALVRRHLRRTEIDKLVHRAWERLEREREDPIGVDIVDLVMDDVANHCASSRPCDRSFQARTQRVDRIGPYATLKISNHHHQKAQARRNQGYQPPGMLQLRQERNNLARLCTQEHYAAFDPRRQQNGGLEHFRQIQNSRAIAERRYVGYLIRYLRNTGRMTPLEASQLQKDFTRQKMSDLNISRGHYLLDLYPTELS